jgi:hypothetical protein
MSLKESILELHKQGFSYNQIKEKLGCSKGTIAYHIGIGQKEKSINRNRSGRALINKYIQEYKSQHCCADCKEKYPYWIMEFDHLRDKKFNLSRAKEKTSSLEKVKEEIAKCEVVCSNCHKNRSFHRLIKNGSTTGIEFFQLPE